MSGNFEALVGRRVKARVGAFQGEAVIVGWQHLDTTGRVEVLIETQDGELLFVDFARDVLMVRRHE